MNNKGVSIIICCFNSALLLQQTLDHIAAQNIGDELDCEVILIDNASTDNTSGKAREIWLKNPSDKIKFSIVHEPEPGLAYARHRGVNEARYDYLVFCDDDNWLDRDYIANVFKLFNRNPEIAVLGGRGIAEMEDESLKPAWFDDFYHGYAVGPIAEKECSSNFVYGAGMAVRTGAYKEVMSQPMFLHGRKQKELTSGEDGEICSRILLAGYQILYSPQLTFKHFLPASRLTWDYLKKLHTGLARAHVVINLYEKALGAKNSKLSPFYWIKKGIYYWGVYLKYWPKQYLVYRKGIGTAAELQHIIWKNIAIDYFKYNFQTISIYSKIFALKKPAALDDKKKFEIS